MQTVVAMLALIQRRYDDSLMSLRTPRYRYQGAYRSFRLTPLCFSQNAVSYDSLFMLARGRSFLNQNHKDTHLTTRSLSHRWQKKVPHRIDIITVMTISFRKSYLHVHVHKHTASCKLNKKE
jgi:hypothetical protein